MNRAMKRIKRNVMNIRVLLCTAGIAAVQVLSAIELTAGWKPGRHSSKCWSSTKNRAGPERNAGGISEECKSFRSNFPWSILFRTVPIWIFFVVARGVTVIITGKEAIACGVWDMRMRLSISIMLVPNFCCVILSLMAIL